MNNIDHFRKRKRTRITTTMDKIREQIISLNKFRKVVKTTLARGRLKIASKTSVRSQFALLAIRSMLVSAGRTIRNALDVES